VNYSILATMYRARAPLSIKRLSGISGLPEWRVRREVARLHAVGAVRRCKKDGVYAYGIGDVDVKETELPGWD